MEHLDLRNIFLKNFVFWLASKPFTTLKDTNDKCLVIIFVYWNVYFYNDFMQESSLVKPWDVFKLYKHSF